MGVITLTLITFGITLLVNKSKLFGVKREFVEKRYEASKVGGEKPGLVHRIWHAWWTCSMCLGGWVAALLCLFYTTPYGWWKTTAIVFGLNWLLHLIETALFEFGKYHEKLNSYKVE